MDNTEPKKPSKKKYIIIAVVVVVVILFIIILVVLFSEPSFEGSYIDDYRKELNVIKKRPDGNYDYTVNGVLLLMPKNPNGPGFIAPMWNQIAVKQGKNILMKSTISPEWNNILRPA